MKKAFVFLFLAVTVLNQAQAVEVTFKKSESEFVTHNISSVGYYGSEITVYFSGLRNTTLLIVETKDQKSTNPQNGGSSYSYYFNGVSQLGEKIAHSITKNEYEAMTAAVNLFHYSGCATKIKINSAELKIETVESACEKTKLVDSKTQDNAG